MKGNVCFIYKDNKISIGCDYDEKMSEVCKRYISQTGIDPKSIYFIYDGIKIDENLTFRRLINIKDSKRLSINIFVYEEEKDKNIINNEYYNKLNYNFKKVPNLKYKLEITDTNSKYGNNDIFEVFTSYKNNKEYIASPNVNNDNMDIFSLFDLKKVYSLQGHKMYIKTVRYFFDKKSLNDYLISADEYKIVIIWDINNNFNIKYKINTKYGYYDDICSCLLIFQNNYNYIITSTDNYSFSPEESGTKIYSFENGQFIKYVKNSHNHRVWYLLSWLNKKNNTNYIIQFGNGKIIVNDLEDNEFVLDLKKKNIVENYFSGFIYSKDGIDYVCSSTSNGLIIIWNLYDKILLKIIQSNNSRFYHIISWNAKYSIVADYDNSSFKIIDLENNKIITDVKHNKIPFRCIKKINHPIYGESLLAGGYRYIELFTIY